jgi:hypothetical protein
MLITNFLLKKEEKDMIDLIKTSMFVKNEDFVSSIKDRSKTFIIPQKIVPEHLKMKVSLKEHREKLKRFLDKISLHENKSVFEENFVIFIENSHLSELKFIKSIYKLFYMYKYINLPQFLIEYQRYIIYIFCLRYLIAVKV